MSGTSGGIGGNGISKDFLIEVRKGNVPGHRVVHKFGRNLNIANGLWEHTSQTPFDIANFNQTPVAVRIKAGGNAADDLAGAGAQVVEVNGIDDSFNEITVSITMAGASASAATTELFWRIHRAGISAVGTYTGANVGTVIVEAADSSKDYLQISAGEGQSQYTGYTIPVGETGYLLDAWGTIDGNKAADIRVFTRNDIDIVTAPMPSKRLRLWWDGIIGKFEVDPKSPIITLNAKTDIWMEARGSGVSTEGTGNLEMLIVKNA